MNRRFTQAALCRSLWGEDQGMSRLSTLIVSAALAMTAASMAHAQGGLILAANDFSGPAGSSSVTVPRSSLEWDAKKARWGLKLGVEQHTDRDVQLRDVQPGPLLPDHARLHIGGAVSLAPDQLESTQRLTDPQLPAPRVRLETTFKF